MQFQFEKWHGCQNDFIIIFLNASHNDTIIDSLKRQARSLCSKSGSGIGLRFASTVANKHGGRLLLSPQKQGSCVSISVPFMNS